MAKYKRGIPVIERIRDFLLDDTDRIKLLEDEQRVWSRIQSLRSLLTENAYSIHDALPIMQKSYGISEATFWRDVRGLFSLFGDILVSNRQGQKWLMYELGMKNYQMAAKVGDVKAMASAHRNMITLLGFDRDEPETIDPEKLNPGMYALVIEEDVRELFSAALSSAGSLDVSKLLESISEEAQFVEHTEIETQKPS